MSPHEPLTLFFFSPPARGGGLIAIRLCSLLCRGKRSMLPHATAMLHQPRVPPTGQRQAIEIDVKWREASHPV